MSKSLRILSVLAFLFLPGVLWAHDVSPGDQAILNKGGLEAYIWVGAKHMLTGYDHLLFLTGVIFFLNGIWDIMKFITVFTLGHCITLIGATYAGLTANEHLVDAVIALSVLYKGFENLGGFDKLKLPSPNLLLMVGIFGLIHGFGLSTRLQSFNLGQDQILTKIISFNVGVELGQVIALIPIIFLIQYVKKFPVSYKAFYKAANVYLVIAGVGLFFYQLYQYI
ncbi:HupE/UreJ family protein [Croceiramulus getboli]|nr:HupE/UreJ family protein [Flavobacteriaceae bacterium YJPT1-3]